MPLVKLHMKSRAVVTALHPWVLEDWMTWLNKKTRSEAIITLADDRGNQYAVQVWEVDYIVIPVAEEKF